MISLVSATIIKRRGNVAHCLNDLTTPSSPYVCHAEWSTLLRIHSRIKAFATAQPWMQRLIFHGGRLVITFVPVVVGYMSWWVTSIHCDRYFNQHSQYCVLYYSKETVYIPGGWYPLPSLVLMMVVTARPLVVPTSYCHRRGACCQDDIPSHLRL